MSIEIKSVEGSPQLQSKTITPSTSTQHVTPSTGYDGLSQVIVNGDSNLISSNIKNGISIFNVAGNYEGKSLQIKTYNSCSVEVEKESSRSYFYYTMPSDLNTQQANEGLFAVYFRLKELGEYGTTGNNLSLYLTAWNPVNVILRRWEYDDSYMYYSTERIYHHSLSRFGFLNNDYTQFVFQGPTSSQDIFQYISAGSVTTTESSSVCAAFCYLK